MSTHTPLHTRPGPRSPRGHGNERRAIWKTRRGCGRGKSPSGLLPAPSPRGNQGTSADILGKEQGMGSDTGLRQSPFRERYTNWGGTLRHHTLHSSCDQSSQDSSSQPPLWQSTVRGYSFFFFLMYSFSFMCTRVYLSVYMCITCLQESLEVRRAGFPQTWSYRWL